MGFEHATLVRDNQQNHSTTEAMVLSTASHAGVVGLKPIESTEICTLTHNFSYYFLNPFTEKFVP